MSKKITAGLLLIALALIVSGCNKRTGATTEGSVNTTVEQNADGVIENVLGALQNNTAMECVYRADNVESVAFIQGQRFKTESTVEGKKIYTLFDGETYLMWSDSDSRGTKVEKSCLDSLNQQYGNQEEQAQGPSYESSEDFVRNENDAECRAVGSVDFSAPNSIEFIDLCAMMQQQIQLMQQLNY